MLEGRRYRLLLSTIQQDRAASYSAAGRCAFNLGKEQRDAALRLGRRMPGYAAQCKDLTELRSDVDWIRAVPVQVCQQALRDCDIAFQRYVRGLAGYPRWRKKGVDESFRVPANRIELRKLSRKWWVVRLPKLGWCRLRWTQPLGGQARNVTVTMDRAGRWWASFCVDTDRQPGIPNGGDAVGVDRGVMRAYQTSKHECDYVNMPGLRPREIERRRRLQRHFAHQNRDSTRRAKTKLQLARLYQREHNRRRDAIHNITIRLATEHGLVAIERLNVGALSASAKGTVLVPGTNVAQKRGLNREIRARGWGEFRRQLHYKAVWYGSQVVEVYPANTSRRCSRCGYTALRNRKSQAVFWCRGCGWGPVNADFNAAINIRERGIELASAPGPGVAARGAFGVGLAGKREPQTGLGQPRQ